MSSSGSVRFSIGGGVLTVANDLVVFVSPDGPVADAWSDLAQTPASEAEIETALASDIPADHHLAFLQLIDNGAALLAAPGTDSIHGSIRRSTDGSIRFGMYPAPDGFWIGSGVVGASGFEVSGFAFDQAEADRESQDNSQPGTASEDDAHPVAPDPSGGSAADPPPPRSEYFIDASPPQPPPPAVDSPDNSVITPSPPPTPVDPPILSADMFADVPIESDPPGSRSLSLSIRFDDGQEVALSAPLAVGRAPEGSNDVPDGAMIVVVSGDQVSRCHFVIRPTDRGAEVIDTNSLNGCFLDDADRPGSGPQIPVGVPVAVEPGQRLRFGDRSFTVIPDQQHP